MRLIFFVLFCSTMFTAAASEPVAQRVVHGSVELNVHVESQRALVAEPIAVRIDLLAPKSAELTWPAPLGEDTPRASDQPAASAEALGDFLLVDSELVGPLPIEGDP